jgi:hypothetical protein
MASVRHSIINEETHDDLYRHVRTVGDVLSLVAPSSSIPLNSLERVTSICAVMTCSAQRTTIVAVVMSSKSNPVVPGKRAHRCCLVDFIDGLLPSHRSFNGT